MPDSIVAVRKGEKRPIYGTITPEVGSVTVLASPASTATMYDQSGTVVGGFSGIGITGFDSGLQPAPKVWLNLDTAAFVPGFYTLVYTVSATGSDGSTRVYEPAIEVQVMKVDG